MQRAAVSPDITTQAGWAAELVATDNFPDLLPALTPDAVYTTAELSAVSLKRPATSANPAATRRQL